MSLKNKTPILPIAIIGAEEMFPYVYQAKRVARFLNLPALPLTPLYLPMPSPVDIYIGKVYEVPNVSPDEPDHIIDEHIKNLSLAIKEMIKKGLENRRPFWGNIK